MKKSPLMGVFLVILIDMLSFGMFIPDLQLRGQKLVTQALNLDFNSTDSRVGLLVGLTLGAFSLSQLFAAPIIGRWSDVVGRKKVLMLSSALSVVSYLIYGHATVLWIAVLSRVISGVAASNIGVAFAYAADVTSSENRAKGLGMLGMAFGIGFIFGPPLGALLLKLGGGEPLVLGYVGAALCALNVAYMSKNLTESHPAQAGPKPGLLDNARTAFSTPGLRVMLIMFFAVNLGFTNLESTYFRLLEDPRSVFHLTKDLATRDGAIILALVGVMVGIMQGGVIRWAEPKFGAVRLVRWCYFITAIGLFMTPHLPLWIPCMLGVIFMGVGQGLSMPSVNALISRNSPMTMQGGIFGITSALGALARFVGPLVSNTLFQMNSSYPYILGAGVVFIGGLMAWTVPLSAGIKSDDAEVALGH